MRWSQPKRAACKHEAVLGDLPEILVSAHEGPQPSVFELLRAPKGRQIRPVAGKDLFAACQDGTDIEERAVGVEHECLDHLRLHHGCEAGWPMTASRNFFANSSAARSSAASCSKSLTPTEATVASGPKTILMPLNEQSSP